MIELKLIFSTYSAVYFDILKMTSNFKRTPRVFISSKQPAADLLRHNWKIWRPICDRFNDGGTIYLHMEETKRKRKIGRGGAGWEMGNSPKTQDGIWGSLCIIYQVGNLNNNGDKEIRLSLQSKPYPRDRSES